MKMYKTCTKESYNGHGDDIEYWSTELQYSAHGEIRKGEESQVEPPHLLQTEDVLNLKDPETAALHHPSSVLPEQRGPCDKCMPWSVLPLIFYIRNATSAYNLHGEVLGDKGLSSKSETEAQRARC